MAGGVYRFGACTLDTLERRLVRDGAIVPLPAKAHDLLAALVERAGHLVSKRELLDVVWPGTAVEEGILAVHVSGLRKALGERDVIETVPRIGYRFTAAVSAAAPGVASVSLRWPVGVLPSRPEVHELVGRGRSHLLTASMAEVPKAVAAFRSAIDIDGTYAAAHAGLALACCAQADLRLASPQAAYAEARAAALRALAMQIDCADAQVALATVLFVTDWNWVGAERSLERAFAVDPDHADGLLLYGRLLEALGRLDAGLAVKQKALERNPFSALVHMQIAQSYWHQRRYDEVIAWANKALTVDPRHLLAHEFIAGAYWKQGDFDRQMEVSLAHAASFGVPPEPLEAFRRIYADGGREAVVRHTIRQGGPPVQLAVLHAELGQLDDAFHHLDAAIAQHDPSLVHLAVAPQWDGLRADPRLRDRLVLMGLLPMTDGR